VQGCLYGLGTAGLLLARTPLGRRKALALPAFFCFVNLASFRAVWNVVRGRRIDRWAPRRGSEPEHRTAPVAADAAGARGGRS
jgi:hypothetical protein